MNLGEVNSCLPDYFWWLGRGESLFPTWFGFFSVFYIILKMKEVHFPSKMKKNKDAPRILAGRTAASPPPSLPKR